MGTSGKKMPSAEEQKKDPEKNEPGNIFNNPAEPKAEDAAGFSEAYWNERRIKLREKYPELMDKDLDYNPEMHAEFIDNLRVKLDKSPGEINNFLDSL